MWVGPFNRPKRTEDPNSNPTRHSHYFLTFLFFLKGSKLRLKILPALMIIRYNKITCYKYYRKILIQYKLWYNIKNNIYYTSFVTRHMTNLENIWISKPITSKSIDHLWVHPFEMTIQTMNNLIFTGNMKSVDHLTSCEFNCFIPSDSKWLIEFVLSYTFFVLSKISLSRAL